MRRPVGRFIQRIHRQPQIPANDRILFGNTGRNNDRETRRKVNADLIRRIFFIYSRQQLSSDQSRPKPPLFLSAWISRLSLSNHPRKRTFLPAVNRHRQRNLLTVPVLRKCKLGIDIGIPAKLITFRKDGRTVSSAGAMQSHILWITVFSTVRPSSRRQSIMACDGAMIRSA